MMYKTIAAHQPNFLPYLGFFDKLRRVDAFVVRDEVSFTKSDFHHRNKIRVNSDDNLKNPKTDWVGVPVENTNLYLKDVLIKDVKRGKMHWRDDLCHRIKTSYRSAPFFDKHFPHLKDIVCCGENNLTNFNLRFIKYIADAFEIKTPFIFASQLGLRSDPQIKSDSSKDLVDICTKLGAKRYLSGDGGRSYLDFDAFDESALELDFQNYVHPKYEQHFQGFIPYMSAIDALFCIDKLPCALEED